MKIAVVTLPLHTNYGGLLQTFALKSYLESLGHEVTVLDPKDKMPLPKWWKASFIYAKRALQRMAKGPAGPEVFREIRFRREYPYISAETQKFIDAYISPRVIRSYHDIQEGDYDAFVVGSDQVWRPRYFGRIEDAFLAFAKDWDVVRLSYAASFGTDSLEYEYFQVEECAGLLERFDGVSVREDAGVQMCQEWFDCDRAVQVVDPVLPFIRLWLFLQRPIRQWVRSFHIFWIRRRRNVRFLTSWCVFQGCRFTMCLLVRKICQGLYRSASCLRLKIGLPLLRMRNMW